MSFSAIFDAKVCLFDTFLGSKELLRTVEPPEFCLKQLNESLGEGEGVFNLSGSSDKLQMNANVTPRLLKM